MQIWPTKKKHPSCLSHNLLYIDAIFKILFYLLLSGLGIFDIKYIICEKNCDFQI